MITAAACRSSGSPETISVLLFGSAATLTFGDVFPPPSMFTSDCCIILATSDASLARSLKTRVPAVCRLT